MDSKAFQYALKNAKEKSLYTKIISIAKRLDQAEIVMEQCRRKYRVVLAEDIYIGKPVPMLYGFIKINLEDPDSQTWVLEQKVQKKLSRCSGCLMKAAIKNGDIHLCVEGFTLPSPKGCLSVETKLRVCPKANCVRNIKGALSNIREMQSDMEVTCSEEIKDTLTTDERN